MANKVTVRQLKKRLDRVFSEYIRRKAARYNAAGFVRCCSCGKHYHWHEVDAGHYISRRHNATRYDERNVHPQCRACNRYDEGNKSGYTVFLMARYGHHIISDLDALGHQTRQFRVVELQDLLKQYREKLQELKGSA